VTDSRHSGDRREEPRRDLLSGRGHAEKSVPREELERAYNHWRDRAEAAEAHADSLQHQLDAVRERCQEISESPCQTQNHAKRPCNRGGIGCDVKHPSDIAVAREALSLLNTPSLSEDEGG
jgi:hypothetical protein